MRGRNFYIYVKKNDNSINVKLFHDEFLPGAFAHGHG